MQIGLSVPLKNPQGNSGSARLDFASSQAEPDRLSATASDMLCKRGVYGKPPLGIDEAISGGGNLMRN